MKILSVKWDVRSVMFLVFGLVFACVVFSGLFALYGLNGIRNSSLTYQRLIAQPREASHKVAALLQTAIGDLYQIIPSDFDTLLTNPLFVKTGTVWERTVFIDSKKEWADAHMEIPFYREAVLYKVQGERCTVSAVIRNPQSEKAYRPQSKEDRLFPFDGPCEFLLQKPNATYLSDQLSWYQPSRRQVDSVTDDPVDSPRLKPHGDGIYRLGRRLETEAGSFIILLALDIRHLIDKVIHILPYPASEIVFPSYLRSDYAILADRHGDFIAGPKPWRMPGYDFQTRKRVPHFTEGDDRDQPLRYPEFAQYPPQVEDLLFLEGKPDGVTLNSFYGKMNKKVKTALHHPVYLDLPNGQGRYFFGTVTIGMKNIDFVARSTEFDRLVKEKIRDVTLALIIALPTVLLILILLFWYWWKKFSVPLLSLTRDVTRINSEGDTIVNIAKLSHDLREFQLLAHSINDLLNRMRTQSRKLLKRSLEERSAATAAQVYHDIQSPVMALDSITHRKAELPEDIRQVLQLSVQRIRALANDLRQRSRAEMKQENVTPVISLVEDTVSEKQFEYHHRPEVRLEVHFPPENIGAFTNFPSTELKRILSNLINNSYEGLKGPGRIDLKISTNPDEILLTISDNGVGIAPHILARLGEKGLTSGKERGSGLGLYHALTTLRENGGSLTLDSELGKGTTVILTLPRVMAPAWFCSSIKVSDAESVVIVDDDPSIQLLWKKRFPETNIFTFESPEQFQKWLIEDERRTFLLICDQEFPNSGQTGLNMIKKLGLESNSILCTFRYFDPQIQEAAVASGVPLLPKNLAISIPIQKLGQSRGISASGAGESDPS